MWIASGPMVWPSPCRVGGALCLLQSRAEAWQGGRWALPPAEARSVLSHRITVLTDGFPVFAADTLKLYLDIVFVCVWVLNLCCSVFIIVTLAYLQDLIFLLSGIKRLKRSLKRSIPSSFDLHSYFPP